MTISTYIIFRSTSNLISNLTSRTINKLTNRITIKNISKITVLIYIISDLSSDSSNSFTSKPPIDKLVEIILERLIESLRQPTIFSDYLVVFFNNLISRTTDKLIRRNTTGETSRITLSVYIISAYQPLKRLNIITVIVF